MADAVKQFQPDDEVLRGVDEVDWTEDPVDDDSEHFDLDSLECVDECDELKGNPKMEVNSRKYSNGNHRRADRKRAYPSKYQRGSKHRDMIKKPMSKPRQESREEAHIPMIPPFAELELVDCCDADENDVRSRPSTSQESRSLISESIHSMDERDVVSPIPANMDGEDLPDDYEDEDFPSLDEAIDVEAMKKASMINSDPPIHLDCSYDQRNGTANHVNISPKNIEVSRKNGTNKEDIHAMAPLNDKHRKSASSYELDSKEKERKKEKLRDARDVFRRSEKAQHRTSSPFHQRRNYNQSRKKNENVNRPEKKENPRNGSTPTKISPSLSNASFVRSKNRPNRERGRPQRRDGGSSTNSNLPRSNANNNIGPKPTNSLYRSHENVSSSKSPSDAARGISELPKLTVQCSKKGGRVVVSTKTFPTQLQSGSPNGKSRRIVG
ncbi:unnamed protein product [Auanema sp. JU1783]|nr:unnamed protein product [Auanema sp. JU1783]